MKMDIAQQAILTIVLLKAGFKGLSHFELFIKITKHCFLSLIIGYE